MPVVSLFVLSLSTFLCWAGFGPRQKERRARRSAVQMLLPVEEDPALVLARGFEGSRLARDCPANPGRSGPLIWRGRPRTTVWPFSPVSAFAARPSGRAVGLQNREKVQKSRKTAKIKTIRGVFFPPPGSNDSFHSSNDPFHSSSGAFHSSSDRLHSSNGRLNASNGPFHSSNGPLETPSAAVWAGIEMAFPSFGFCSRTGVRRSRGRFSLFKVAQVSRLLQ